VLGPDRVLPARVELAPALGPDRAVDRALGPASDGAPDRAPAPDSDRAPARGLALGPDRGADVARFVFFVGRAGIGSTTCYRMGLMDHRHRHSATC